jgi:hypothetical protein
MAAFNMLNKYLLAALLLFGAKAAAAQAPAGLPVVATVDELATKASGVRYYDGHWVPLPGAAGSEGYDVYQRLDSAGLQWRLRRYLSSPRPHLLLEQFFAGLVPTVGFEGPSREWYPEGPLREEVTYHKGRIVGTLRTFYPNGKVRRTEAFTPVAATACYDSLGRALARCPDYHTFARLRGKNTYSGKFLDLVQRQYAALLPPGYAPVVTQTIMYAFRIDPAGAVRDARLLTAAAPELEKAIVQAIAQLPAFEPARLEGEPVDDVVEGAVTVKAGRR